MDVKSAIDAFSVHDASGKVQELGERACELGERSLVSVTKYCELPLPKQRFFLCQPKCLTLANRRR